MLRSFLFIVLLTGCFRAWSQEDSLVKWQKDHLPHKTPLVVYTPSVQPDRITLVPAGYGFDSLKITWRTDTSISGSLVEFYPAEDLKFDKSRRKRFNASHRLVATAQYDSHYHTATVSGLDSGQLYQYRVGSSSWWSTWNLYRHVPQADTLRMLYFGDTQNDIYKSRKVFHQAYKDFPQSRLVLHIGDLVNHAGNDYEWAEWHSATALLNETLPVLAVPGNHEYYKDKEGHKTDLTSLWGATFPFPSSRAGDPYYVDYGPARLVLLNSNKNLEAQAVWLDSLLAITDTPWVVLAFHHPVFSGSLKRYNQGINEHWMPVITRYKDKIGLVLQGHDHTYARGGPADRKADIKHPDYPVFTVSVVGTKRYALDRQSWMDVAWPDVSSYQYIEITATRIHYRAISETGLLIDEFTLMK